MRPTALCKRICNVHLASNPGRTSVAQQAGSTHTFCDDVERIAFVVRALGSTLSHLHRDRTRPYRIGPGNGLTLQHPCWDTDQRRHICTVTAPSTATSPQRLGSAAATSARDWAHPAECTAPSRFCRNTCGVFFRGVGASCLVLLCLKDGETFDRFGDSLPTEPGR